MPTKANVAQAQDTGAKECGLHSGNMVAAAAAQAAGEQQRDLWVGGAVEALDKAQLQALLAGPRERHTLVVFYAPWCPFSQARDPLLGPGKGVCACRGCACLLQKAGCARPATAKLIDVLTCLS